MNGTRDEYVSLFQLWVVYGGCFGQFKRVWRQNGDYGGSGIGALGPEEKF